MLISARVATAYEAFQMGGMVVIPVVLLLFGQVSGLLIFGPLVVLVLGVVAWALALGVLNAGLGYFRRPELLNRV